MTGTATVLGAHGQIHTLTFNTASSLALARQLAAQINNGVLGGSIIPAEDNTAPTVAGGQHEFVQTQDGATRLPAGYSAVVLDTANATVKGASDVRQSVLGGAVNATYINDHVSASGAIALGGGNDRIVIGPRNTGDWTINVGNGNDTIDALGSGAHTITAGSGNSHIKLGSGTDLVNVSGSSTIIGGSGKETLFGGTGADLTFIGGRGNASVVGGEGGDNHFTAGSGNETLIGGADASGGSDVFTFINHRGGANDLIENFAAGDHVRLKGFSQSQINAALQHQTVGPGGVSITLSDNTKITFSDVTKLDPHSFN